MNHSQRLPLRMAALLFAGAVCGQSPIVLAQETTASSSRPTSITRTVTVDSAQVVYVSGDDVVLKDSAGRLLLLAMPQGTPLIVDGKPAALKDLTPGTTLSHVRAGKVVESQVTTVTQIDGEITQVTPPKWVTLRLGDGIVKRYEIPKEATFQVNGTTATAFELKKGMKLSATAVTTEGVNAQSNKAAIVGQTPPQIGTLLIFRGR